MLSEWGTATDPFWMEIAANMNPTFKMLLANNKADVIAIVEKIGLSTLIDLAPRFESIVATIVAAERQAQKPAKTS
jgi:hypothetical protein